MFKKQQLVMEALPQIRGILDKHQRPGSWLPSFERAAQEYVVRVPLLGGFSSGKSSLLNALIQERLLATNIDPETAIPAELGYGPSAQYIACQADGSRLPIAREAITSNQLDHLQSNGWLEVTLPAPALAPLPHLRLVDMPGWSSGNARHSEAIDNYVSRSLAYAVVVSVDEGSLHETLRNSLGELQLHNKPVLAVISKSDKKTADDAQKVAAQVASEIEKLIGKPPMDIVISSARKEDTASLSAALAKLEQQAEPLFNSAVARPFAQELRGVVQYLDTLINQEDLDAEKIKERRANLAEELQRFDAKLNAETAQLEGRLPNVLASIVQHVQVSLGNELDSLAAMAVRGRDLRATIEQVMRMAITRGIHDEFEPELRSYFSNVSEALPGKISLDLSLPEDNFIASEATQGIDQMALKAMLTTALAAVLKLHPWGRFLLPLVPLIADLLSSLFKSKGDQEARRIEQREAARDHLITEVFPKVKLAVEDALRPVLHEQVKQAQANIAQSVERQKAELNAALDELNEQLRKGKEAFEAARSGFILDRNLVLGLLLPLEAEA
jgi:GTP-binding protein EngB required for normal cell division